MEEDVGVGAYFGRLDWQTDSVARVKSLVAGGPAEQTGMIDIGDAVRVRFPGLWSLVRGEGLLEAIILKVLTACQFL